MREETRRKIQTLKEFEEGLREEISVSAEFDLPLSVLIVFRDDEWDQETTYRALDVLRATDLYCLDETFRTRCSAAKY